MRREPEPPDLIECRECGNKFDLNSQHYYDNICPSCLREKGDDEAKRTWKGCVDCQQKINPANLTYEYRGRGTDKERLPVHSGQCPDEN